MTMGKEFSLEHDARMEGKFTEDALDALTKVGWVFLGDANTTIPYDTFDMRNSGAVTTNPHTATVTVSYDTPYAVRQHEDTTLNHKPGRRARWLELTGSEKRETYLKLLSSLIGKKNGAG